MPEWPTSTSSRSAASRSASSAAERAAVFCAGSVTRTSWTCLEDEVEGRLGGAPEAREAGALDDLAAAGLAGLGAEREPDLLGQGRRRADERREAVVHAADRVEVLLDPVAGGGLDDHPAPVRSKQLADVPRSAGGVAHVVQAIEHRHEVVAAAGMAGPRSDLERDAVGDPGLLGPHAGGSDRAVMVVGADDPRAWERLRHQDGRRAVAAADVRDPGAALELLDHALERRQPCGHDVRVVAGPEEALAALEHVVAVFAPAEAAAVARRLDNVLVVARRAEGELEEPRQVRRARLVRQR